MPVFFFSVLLFQQGESQVYLKLLSSDGLHVTFFANKKFVGDTVVGWVMLSPGKLITVLNNLRHKLVVTTLLNHVSRDTWSAMAQDDYDSACVEVMSL